MTTEAFESRMNLLRNMITVCRMKLAEAERDSRELTDDEIKAISGSCCMTYKDLAGNKCVQFMTEDAVQKLIDSIKATGIDVVGRLIDGGRIDGLIKNMIQLGPEECERISKGGQSVLSGKSDLS